jgi:hypothetical protein
LEKGLRERSPPCGFGPMAGLRPAIMLPVLVFVSVRSSFF